MPHAEAHTSENDAPDDLFAYDESLDDVFNVNEKTSSTHIGTTGSADADASGRKDLGIDDEIIITKKRAPIAKLDDTRLVGFQPKKHSPRLQRLQSPQITIIQWDNKTSVHRQNQAEIQRKGT